MESSLIVFTFHKPLLCPFFGKPLHVAVANPNPRRRSSQPAALRISAAAVKRRKEIPFDAVIQRDKKLKLVLKIRSILVNQPDRVMSLRDLGRFRRDLGLTRQRRFIALLRRFPAVFEIVEEGVYSLKFRLTPAAERIYFEELKAKAEMETAGVDKLRKLLMMSAERRILLEKISHLKADLGLPYEFRDTICVRYPHYFRTVGTDRGPALELTSWDPALAVSAAEAAQELNQMRDVEERNYIIDRHPRFNRPRLPKGLVLSKGEMRRLQSFNALPYVSPYADFSHLQAGTPEKERHACAVVHEILSLTLEKRTLVDHLTHFREEFRFSQQIRGMLIRHPDMFYVSLKGDRDSVFLREAYQGSELVEKSKLLLLKEKMRELVVVPQFPRRGQRFSEGAEGGEGRESDDFDGEDDDDEEAALEEMEDLLRSIPDNDLDEGYADGGALPPDFDDDVAAFSQGIRLGGSRDQNSDKQKVLDPAQTDSRPRERW